MATSDADDQSQRGTQLLEIYALEIQMYNETRNFKKLKVEFLPHRFVRIQSHRVLQEIYNASNAVRSAIPHPRIMGVIKECGGKMWMGERMQLHSLIGTKFQTSHPNKVNGTGQAKISLSPSGTTTKLDPPKEFKSLNIWYWPTC